MVDGRSLSRRSALGCLGVAGLACAPHVGEAPTRAVTRPRPVWPDGPAPEVVLEIASGSKHLTWYADGLVLRVNYESDVMMYGSDEMIRSPELRLLHVGVEEVARLRGLVAADDVQTAASAYTDPSMHDGGHLFIGAGARRIQISHHLVGFPDALQQLKDSYHATNERFDAEGVDAFVASEPRLVAVHNRGFRRSAKSDELYVYANGVLDYRVLTNGWAPSGDYKDPQIRLARVAPGELAAVKAALADIGAVPPASRSIGDGAKSGTSHMLAHAGQVPRIRVSWGEPVPASLVPVFAAMQQLRRSFDAPEDEAG